MDEHIIFELVRRSYEEMEILECRNHELELENKRLCIALELREAETMPEQQSKCSFVIKPGVRWTVECVQRNTDDNKAAADSI